MRVIFMGTPEFAVPSLQALIESEHDVVAVYSQPPRPAKRGQKVQLSPTHTLAGKHGIPVETPTSLKKEEAQQTFNAYEADIAVVAAYGLLLPKAILDAPEHGCINLHPSLLPRWRGAAPLQHTVLAGDKKSGVCIMQMDEGLDTGDVLLKIEVDLPDDITTPKLHDDMAALGAKMILETIKLIGEGKQNPIKQSDTGVEYAHKLTKQDSIINWQDTATNIDRKIRAFNPWPGTTSQYQGETIKVIKVQPVNKNSGKPAGEIIDTPCIVQCGEGAISIERLQRAGKKPMDIEELIRGFPMPIGSKFE